MPEEKLKDLEIKNMELKRQLQLSNEKLQQEAGRRGRVENGLSLTKALLDAVISQSPVPMVVVTADGTIEIFNEASRETLGFSYDEVAPGVRHADMKKSWETYDADGANIPIEYAPIILALKGKNTKNKEIRIVRKDGSERWLLIDAVPVYEQGGNIIAGFAVFQDITERKKAEVELQKSEEKYRRFLDLSPDPIVIIQDDRHVFINQRYTELFGYTMEDVDNGLSISQLVLEKDREMAVRRMKERLAGKESGSEYIVVDIVAKDGRIIPCEVAGNIVEYNSRPADFVIIRDITERKSAESEKRQLEIQLQQSQKMEAIGTLAGGIAHDFNNILAAILGYAELSQNNLESPTLLEKYLKEVISAGLRAKELVQQILTFSRQRKQDLKPVQIKFIVKEALKLIRASLPSTIEIRQNINSDPLVMSNPTQIHQILMNLCTNAAHAMREKGGVLDVGLDDVELDSDFIAANPDLTPGHYVRLTVGDTGHGMPIDVMNRIFIPFFTTKEKDEGTGMGLSVVHGIIKSFGGTIDVYSEPERGSTFKVYLPAIERRLEPEAEIEKPIPRGTERILFVDDERPVVDMGKQLLEPLGYEVTTRTSSIEALELFKAQPEAFDIVISDITMPNMTGDMLTKELISIRPDIPIILCSGFSERVSEEKVKMMGARAFAMKPLLRRQMAATLRQVLDKGKEEASVQTGRILVVDNEERIRSMLRIILEGEGYSVSEAPDGKVALWLYREKPADLIITDLASPENEGVPTLMKLKQDFPRVKIVGVSEGGEAGNGRYIDPAGKIDADITVSSPVEKEELLKAVKKLLT